MSVLHSVEIIDNKLEDPENIEGELIIAILCLARLMGKPTQICLSSRTEEEDPELEQLIAEWNLSRSIYDILVRKYS